MSSTKDVSEPTNVKRQYNFDTFENYPTDRLPAQDTSEKKLASKESSASSLEYLISIMFGIILSYTFLYTVIHHPGFAFIGVFFFIFLWKKAGAKKSEGTSIEGSAPPPIGKAKLVSHELNSPSTSFKDKDKEVLMEEIRKEVSQHNSTF